MKKNYLQKILAVALAGTMAMGTLTGCGSEPASGSGESSSAPESEQEESAEDSEESSAEESSAEESSAEEESSEEAGGTEAGGAGIAGYTAFAEPVTLKIPVYDRGQEGVPAIGTGDNVWEGWIQENFGDKYNITMEFVPITRTAVLESYNLLAADQNLPTILMEYDYPKQAQWVADGMLTTYDMEQFKEIAPTYYQRMVDLDQIKYTTMNDETYFVLAERPYYNTNYTFITWYRMDWLEEVGYDHIPATRAEYLDAMKKIQDAGLAEHPGGGAMTTGTAGIDQNYAFREYPTNEEEWAMYGDYAIPSLGWEPNKRLLKEQNENYNLGITNPEYYTIDAETAKANFINGDVYQYSDYIAADIAWLTSFYETNPDAHLVAGVQSLEADTEYGTVPAFRSNNPFGMMIGFSSQASEDEIKAAMMYMEWMTQEENLFVMQWGYENDNFTYNDSNLPESVADYAGENKQGFSNNKDYWCVTIEARNAGTIEDMIRAASPKGLPEDFTDDIIQNYYNQVEAWEKGWVPTDCMFATDLPSVAEYQGTLLTLYAELRDALVMCDPAEFDALYEESAQRYAEAGYEEITQERLKAYQDGLSSRME